MATVAFTTRANLVGGQPENIADVTSCLDALLAGVNTVDTAQLGALAVTDAKVAASTITDAKLASPNNVLWRTVRTQPFGITSSLSAATYFFSNTGRPSANTGAIVYSTNVTEAVVQFIHIPSLTDYAVAGKTAQGRLVVHSLTNPTAPGTVLGFGLYPISSISGSSVDMSVTLGVGVVGSFVNLTATANSAQQAAGAAFTLPSGAGYLLGVQFTSTIAVNCICAGVIDLQIRFT